MTLDKLFLFSREITTKHTRFLAGQISGLSSEGTCVTMETRLLIDDDVDLALDCTNINNNNARRTRDVWDERFLKLVKSLERDYSPMNSMTTIPIDIYFEEPQIILDIFRIHEQFRREYFCIGKFSGKSENDTYQYLFGNHTGSSQRSSNPRYKRLIKEHLG